MVRLSFDEQMYESAEACLAAIRDRVAVGWEVIQISETIKGHCVVYRLCHEAAASGPQTSGGGRS